MTALGSTQRRPARATDGIGLMGIRERLTPLGGVLSIASAPGSGTELRVTIPLGH